MAKNQTITFSNLVDDLQDLKYEMKELILEARQLVSELKLSVPSKGSP